MTYRVFVSERAVEDVIRNADWWARHHSSDDAAKWYAAIMAKIYSLDQFPESHALAYENPRFSCGSPITPDFGLGSRPGYRILFTVRDDTVNVLTVKAAEEDWISPSDLNSCWRCVGCTHDVKHWWGPQHV